MNPQQKDMINQNIESDLYSSPDGVIDAALRLLGERDRKLEALRRDIEEGLSSGPGSPLDKSVVRDIKKRALEHFGRRETPE